MTRRIVVELHDGRWLDMTGLTPDAVMARLREQGVMPDQIKRTWHYVSAEEIGQRA